MMKPLFQSAWKKVEQKYCEIIKVLAEAEKIELLVLDEKAKIRIQKKFSDLKID